MIYLRYTGIVIRKLIQLGGMPLKELLSYTGDIADICKGMRIPGITFFKFALSDINANTVIYLTNRSDWLTHYLSMNYCKISHYNTNNLERLSCWSTITDRASEIHNDATVHFNISNGITITLVHQKQHLIERFFFGTTRENTAFESFCINNLDCLYDFIYYFKDKAKKIISEANSQHTINFPSTDSTTLPTISTLKNKSYSNDIRRYYTGPTNSYEYLTRRETECLRWSAHGKSIDEIAVILGLTNRTVESYLSHAKKKFGCHKLTQAIYLACKANII